MWKQSDLETLPLQKPLLAWEWWLYPCIAKTRVVWFKHIWNKRHIICELVVAQYTYWHSLAFGKGTSEPLLPVTGRKGVPLYWAWAAQLLAPLLSQCLVGNLFSGNQTWLEILYVYPFFHLKIIQKWWIFARFDNQRVAIRRFPSHQTALEVVAQHWDLFVAWFSRLAGRAILVVPSVVPSVVPCKFAAFWIECGFLENNLSIHLDFPLKYEAFFMRTWNNLDNYEIDLQFHEH